MRLRGPLELEPLRRALTEVVRRHEALRTTLMDGPGGPAQRVHPPAPVQPPFEDLSAAGAESREREMERMLSELLTRPFDLVRGPPWRASLLRLGPDEHVFALACHHIIFDGWAAGIVVRELAALYAAYAAGRPSPLSEPALQLADVAAWQRRQLEGHAGREMADAFARAFAGARPLRLPLDRPRPPAPRYRGGVLPFSLPCRETRALERISRDAGVTLFTTLSAALAVALAGVTGQDDFALVTPVANRLPPQAEEVVGFVSSSVVIRADLRGDPGFAQVLRRMHHASLAALSLQQFPLMEAERILREQAGGEGDPVLPSHCSWPPPQASGRRWGMCGWKASASLR